MISRVLGAAVLAAAISGLPALAQTNEPSGRAAPAQATAPANPRPPYLLAQGELLTIAFEADENALRSLLPPGVQPAPGNVVGLNMYHADQVVGLVPYAASYLWIDVAGFDSPEGPKGRWMAEGWYGPEPVPTVFKTQMGFPVQLGVTRLEHQGNHVHAVLNRGGVDVIDATIAVGNAAPASLGAVLNYLTWGPNVTAPGMPASSGVVVNRIPAIGEATTATPVALDFHFSDTDAAKVLRPKRVLGAAYVKLIAGALGYTDAKPREAGTESTASNK